LDFGAGPFEEIERGQYQVQEWGTYPIKNNGYRIVVKAF